MNGAVHTPAAQQGRVGGVHDGIGLLARDVTGTRDRENAVPHRYAQDLRAGMHVGYLLLNASTPGNFLPSRNSSDAPPPVEMCVILSSTPAALTAATLSPPPTMETAAPLSATAYAIFFVPLAKASISNMPMGPVHTMLRARLISVENSS